MDSPLQWLFAAFATIFLLATFLRNKEAASRRKGRRKLPEPRFAWPIIGHFHLLAGNNRLPHKVLGDMADIYGPIFGLRLCAHRVMVVSDSRIAKECLTVNDRALAGRPKTIASEHIGYNHADLALCPPNPFWRDARKVVVLELLSSRRLEALRRVRESAVKRFTKEIYRRVNDGSGEVVKLDMSEWFGRLIIGVMLEIMFGHSYEDVGSWVAATFRRNFELLGLSVVGDFLPWLRWLDIGGYEKAIKENTKEMDDVVDCWLQQHRMKLNTKPKEEEDFLDALISHYDSHKEIPNGYDADTAIKATCTGVLSAAIDTTTTTLIWALSLVLNNGDVLDKIRNEVDSHVGRERHVNESDLNNLTYIQAVVKETLRLYPPGPLLVPHEAIEDCVVNGYHVSKGTRLLVNVAKIQRDPKFWSDPDAFKPERFLMEHKEVDVRGNHFDLLPFGSGRRMCPGISLGLQSVQLGLASVIHGFDIRRSLDEKIDMTEAAGLSVTKATPLEALLTPRLPLHLYS
nr:cytochrome P450 CYP82D47-like [Ipomoea trifida]